MRIHLYFNLPIQEIIYFNVTELNILEKLQKCWEEYDTSKKYEILFLDRKLSTILQDENIQITDDIKNNIFTNIIDWYTIETYSKFDLENIVATNFIDNQQVVEYRIVGELDLEQFIEDLSN